MIVISFYTDARYRAMAEAMYVSACRFGVACEIQERPDLGSWVANTNQKPDAILDAMDRHPGRASVLWVDADSEFFASPGGLIGRHNPPDADLFIHLGYVWGSTMNFANTPHGRELVESWQAQCRMTPEYSSDGNMKLALDRNPARWHVAHLPQEYAVCDDPESMGLPVCGRPVIRHRGIADWNTHTAHVPREALCR